jgi:hypothetical protein
MARGLAPASVDNRPIYIRSGQKVNSQVRSWLLWTALFIVPAFLAFLVERQGFNMLDDGLWAPGYPRGRTWWFALSRHLHRLRSSPILCTIAVLLDLWGERSHPGSIQGGCCRLFVDSRVLRGPALWRRAPRLADSIGGLGNRAGLTPLCLCSRLRRISCGSALAYEPTVHQWPASRYCLGVSIPIRPGHVGLRAIIVFAGHGFTRLLASNALTFRDLRIAGMLVGLAGVLAIALLFAAATGTLAHAAWDTVVCPLAYSPHHVTLNFLESFFRPQGMNTAFSQVFTGEHLGPAWPGHVGLRVAAIQMIAGLVFAVPFLAFIARRQAVDTRMGSLFALALSSWVVILWRSDVAHVFAAFYGTLFVAVCLLGVIRLARIPVVLLGVVFLVAAMAPLAGERLWLVTHANRSSLIQWDRPTAEIAMAKGRHETIERVLATLDAGNESPTIGWPAQPGLAFLSGRPLATRQVTLLSGSVRDEASVIADLHKSGPEQLVLGRAAGLTPGARSVDELAPSIWTYLRSNYFVELQIADGAEGFQVIRNAGRNGVDLESLPLERRLPGTSQLVKNAQTPPLSPGVVISQVFRVGGIDLRGIVLLFATTGTLPTEMDMEIEIEELLAGGRSQSLAVFRSRVPLDQNAQPRTLAFPVIPRTAGKMIVLKLSATLDSGHEVRLLWHDPRADKGKPVDYYPEGHALLNGRPVDADLFFISY